VEALARRLTGLDYEAMKSLLDEIPVGIGIAEPVEADGTVRPDARITFYNKKWTEMFGFDTDDVETVEQATRRLYPDPEVHARMMRMRDEAAGRIREGGGSEQTEIRAMGAGGEWLDVITGTTVVGDRLVVTMLDVSRRKKAEAEATMRERITLAARAAKSAFWEWDLVTGAVTWSPEMMDFFGVPESERQDNRDPWRIWRARVHPDDWPAAEAHAKHAHDTHSPIDQVYRVIMPDGEIRWIESRGDIIRDEAGRAVRIAGINIDVSARKKAEQSAENYRAQLEKLVDERTTELDAARRQIEKLAYEVTENIPAGTYTMVQPADGGFARFFFLSSRFLEMCGLTREEAEQDPLNVFALVHPEDYDEFIRKNIEALERKTPFREEFRVIVGGETRWFHAASNPRPLPDGTTLWEGVLTDITDRKEAEVARTKSDRSMKLAASAARLGFWEIDISTQLDRWDAEMARIHGIRHEDFDGHWEKFVHPDDYDEVMRETRRMLADETTFEMEYRIVRPSGETRFIREHGIVIRDREGRPVSASGVMQDITERRQAEEEIHASTQRMRLAASAAGLGFWSRDNATGLEEWDDEMLRIYGVRREDFDGRWEPFVHPADAATVQRLTRDAAASGHVGAYEYRIIRPDGTVRHVRGRSTFVPGRDGRAAREIGVNFDITGEKEAAERENRLQADHRSDLEKKLKTSLNAAVVAHEINQPLSAILLDTQVALERVQGDTPELAHARKFLCSTIAHATRAVETIGKVSTLLRSVPTTPHEVNLVDVVRSAALYAKDDLRTAGIALDTTGTGRAVTIQGDEGQLLLAVSNMLRNAIEALRSDDGGRPREIVIALTRHKTSVILSVADSGPGLPPNILAKIPLHTTKPDGTGLGLFIVQTVAENHGATLEAGPSKLGGAELRLVFPAAK
jgi:PAS domain S-box-containing protein